MFSFEEALKGVNTPLDWAIVFAAGTVGFSADALINIVPAPVFSPGVCGVMAISSALAAKKGFDAARQAKRTARLSEIVISRAERFERDLIDAGQLKAADDLHYLILRAKADPSEIERLSRAVETGPNRQLP